eukprot:scaffold31815_cov118-Isochrysis_galbana.AAC.16
MGAGVTLVATVSSSMSIPLGEVGFLGAAHVAIGAKTTFRLARKKRGIERRLAGDARTACMRAGTTPAVRNERASPQKTMHSSSRRCASGKMQLQSHGRRQTRPTALPGGETVRRELSVCQSICAGNADAAPEPWHRGA